MKLKNFVIPVAIVATFALGACKSEITDKTAAEVSEVTETVAAEEAPAGERIAVIKEESKIEFVGAKVTRDHVGGFHEFDGNVAFIDGMPSSIDFTIDLNSIWTDTERLTGHLKSADFFEVETYPTATFESSGITAAPEGNADNATHMISGTLDMHGVTKMVTFPANVMDAAEGISATAEFTINRQDWGIAYAGKPDDLIKDNVLIKLDLRFPSAPGAAAGEAAPGAEPAAEPAAEPTAA